MSVVAEASTDKKDWIETYTGARFYLDSPIFRIEDIAHGLSNTCRYSGQSRHFYSVAEHSVITSLIMQELQLGDPMEGLLHDATEAYLTDMPRPWKDLIPGYKDVERRLEGDMRDYFHLPAGKTMGCDIADHIAFFVESWFLMPTRGQDYGDPLGVRPKAMRLVEAHWRTLNLLPTEAEAAFLKRYQEVLP